MPKEMKRRRIDGKPPRLVRRTGAGGGGGTTVPPGDGIGVVRTFEGGGPDGTTDVFSVPGGLLATDMYVIATIAVCDYTTGTPTVIAETSPRALSGSNAYGGAGAGINATISAYYVGSSGGTSFTVTISGGGDVTNACFYYGWLLRGARTGLDTDDTIGDDAYSELARAGGCEDGDDGAEISVDPLPAHLIPAEVGAFTAYVVGTRTSICETSDIPVLGTDGGTIAVHDYIGSVPYEAGTCILTGGEAAIGASFSSTEHGALVAIGIISVYPATVF